MRAARKSSVRARSCAASTASPPRRARSARAVRASCRAAVFPTKRSAARSRCHPKAKTRRSSSYRRSGSGGGDMNASEALGIVRSLASGVDPVTGDAFPEESAYQRPQVVRRAVRGRFGARAQARTVAAEDRARVDRGRGPPAAGRVRRRPCARRGGRGARAHAGRDPGAAGEVREVGGVETGRRSHLTPSSIYDL